MKTNAFFKNTVLYLTVILSICLTGSCKKSNDNIPDPTDDEPSTQQPRVTASGNKLITSDGKAFKVWGFNYGAGSDEGLMDDNWNNEATWKTFDSDFKEMKDLGANMLRIHLQYNKFMNGPTQPNQRAYNNLKRMVKLAEKYDLYLLITGLGAYRKSDQPAWYNDLSDDARWATQAVFWQNVASSVGHSPAILGYDLINEPVVAVDSTNGWLPGNGFGGFYYVQNIALRTKGKPWPSIMRDWIRTMANAIRKADAQNMITVGFLSFNVFADFSNELDLMTTHLYPTTGKFDADNLSIQKFQSDKPLIITEIYPLNTGANELQAFIEQNNPFVSGWTWHYFGKTIEDYTPPKDMGDALRKVALEKFKEMSATQK